MTPYNIQFIIHNLIINTNSNCKAESHNNQLYLYFNNLDHFMAQLRGC